MATRQAVFSSEKALQVRLAATVDHLANRAGETLVRREMPVGGCIPDLLLVSLASVPRANIWPSRWSYRHACVVAQLRRAPTLCRPSLAARTYETEDRLDPLLDDLLESGAISESATGSLRLSPEMRNFRACIVAVEAKLARWSDALKQALTYRNFSDRVIVAMDAGLFDTSNNGVVDRFRREGVGLCVVDYDGPKSLHQGRRVERVSAQREYICSSVFAHRSQTLWMRR